MFDMHDKVAIITGGSGGIGYEVARGLAEAGCDIALWYNRSKNATKLAATIEKDFSTKCKAYQCDVASFDQVSGCTGEGRVTSTLADKSNRYKQVLTRSSKTLATLM